MEYRMAVAGFGTWRITYEPKTKRWDLAYNVRATGEQWVPAGDHILAETAALAVGERTTGVRSWDSLRFAVPNKCALNHWTTDASEGVQDDATV